MLAAGPNGVRALASQQDIAICDPDGLVTYRQGQLHQWPPASESPPGFTVGYGWEIPTNGLGSAPSQRGGQITYRYGTILQDAATTGTTAIYAAGWVGTPAQVTLGGQTLVVEYTVEQGNDLTQVQLAQPVAGSYAAGTACTVVFTLTGTILSFNGDQWTTPQLLIGPGGSTVLSPGTSSQGYCPLYQGKLATYSGGSYSGVV